jgi:hypothetical protein
MALPKTLRKNLPLTPVKVLTERRQELLDKIQDKGTYLPKGVLHADLDKGMLEFVKNDLLLSVDGKKVPVIDKIITNQSWSQFTETWDFKDLDDNIKLPFISTVRMPEVKFGTSLITQYKIPDRRQFLYAQVPTWDGQRKGFDVYTIPQPIPVDISFNIKIFCNRMRELNEFNKIVNQKFASRQAYTVVKGHYIPIIWEDVSDESTKELEKRKYYVQNYKFLMQGFLLDEEEFKVSPGITRQVTMFETDVLNTSRKVNPQPERPNFFDFNFPYFVGVTGITEPFFYTADLKVTSLENVSSYSVYINDNYVGDDIETIQVSNGDVVTVDIVKISSGSTSTIKTTAYLQ